MPEARINIYTDPETADKLKLAWFNSRRQHGMKYGAWLLYPRIQELKDQEEQQ